MKAPVLEPLFNKGRPSRPAPLLYRDSALEHICEMFKKTFFYKSPQKYP